MSALGAFLDAGRPEESVLVYFSGHGHDARGTFNLVVGTSRNSPGHVLNVRWIAEKLAKHPHHHNARFLLILDCCDAGAASGVFWNDVAGDRLRIWVAARTYQQALELDGDNPGGLFTSWIRRALGERAAAYAVDGRLLVNRLSERARAELGCYRTPEGDPAPKPTLYGADSDDILLADNVPVRANGWDPTLLASLRTALTDLGVGDARAGDSYAYCQERADANILPPIPRQPSLGTLLDALEDPARFYFAGNRLKLPMLTFTAHLAAALDQPKTLTAWLQDARQWLLDGRTASEDQINEAMEVIELPARAESRPRLMLQVAEDLNSDGYTLACAYLDEHGEPADHPDPQTGLTAPEALIGAIVDAVEGLPAGAPCTPQIEAILPFRLLADDAFIDALERALCGRSRKSAGRGKGPSAPQRLCSGSLAAAFPFVLRCWERWFETLLVDDRGGTKVREHWAAHHERCLPNAPKPPCLAWVKPRQGQTLESVALGRLKPPPPKSGALALAHDQAVGTEDLAALLELGVPILLWPRHRAASAAQLQGLKAQLKQAPHDRLQHLPLALHSHRVTEIGACPPQPCDFSLLWDTPGHPGLEQRDYDPSSLDAASLAPPTLDPEPQ
jgi:hypothetical protein